MSNRFARGRLSVGEDVNPLDGLINLADIMLVLAAGLMLALIINWNIDIGDTGGEAMSVSQGEEVTENMQGLGQDSAENAVDYTQYEKMGIVYKDPVTGKLYMVTSGE